VAAAAVMRASHRATRVTVAPAAALTSLPREIRDTVDRVARCSPLARPLIVSPATCHPLSGSPTTYPPTTCPPATCPPATCPPTDCVARHLPKRRLCCSRHAVRPCSAGLDVWKVLARRFGIVTCLFFGLLILAYSLSRL